MLRKRYKEEKKTTRPSIHHQMAVIIVQLLRHVLHFAIPRTASCQTSLSFTISGSLLKLMSIESVMPSNHLILCCPLLLLPSVFPSIRVFSHGPSSDQSNGASASASVLPVNIQSWFPLELTSLILPSKGLSRVFSNATVQKHNFFGTHTSLWSSSHIHTWPLEKPQLWLDGLLLAK